MASALLQSEESLKFLLHRIRPWSPTFSPDQYQIFFFQSTYSTKVKWKGLLSDQCVGVKVVLYYPQYTKRGRRSLSCLPVISCLKPDEYLHFRAQVNFRVSQNNFCFFRAKGSHNLSWEKIWSINHFGPKGSKIGQQVWKMVPLIPEKWQTFKIAYFEEFLYQRKPKIIFCTLMMFAQRQVC